MVSRKYLCAAPQPSQWDEKAESLLKSLGGSKQKRKKFIEQTLSALSEVVINDSKRSGPGRKSNAEHAINFYQYILQLDTQEAAASSDAKPSEEKCIYVDIDRNKRMELQDFLDQHNDLCEVCNQGGDLLCCNTCNLVFHLHCSRPKLTKMPADIWNCSFCIASGVTGHKRESRVRRRASSAVREMLRLKRSLPPTDNDDDKHSVASSNSMHSVLDDETRHQDKNDMSPKSYHNFLEKNLQIEECMEIDEQEKNMTPVQNKKIKQEDNTSMILGKIDAEEDGKSKEKDDMIMEMTSNSTGPDEDKEDDVVTDTVDLNDSTNKRKRDTEENVVESEDGKEGPTRKMRRLRRQPIMYDPQTCAASEWQSDGVFEWKTLSPSERGVPNRQLSIGTTTEETRRKSTLDTKAREISKAKHVDDGNHDEENNPLRDSMWCNFCRDDPTIPVCCFCGCRNCFGKHNKSNLLICDVCDEEYHTTCLKPPLTHVPKSRRWLCTNCRIKEKDGVKLSLRRRSAIKPSQVTVTERDSSMGSIERRRSSGRVANLDSTKKETSEEKKIPVRSTRGESTLEKNHVTSQTQGIDRRQSIKVASSSNSPQLSEGKSNIANRTIHKKVNTSQDTTKPMDTASESIGTKQTQISPNQKLSIEKVKTESSIPPEVSAQEIRPPVLDPNKSNGKALTILEETKENESTLISPPKAVQRSRSGRMVKQSRFHDELHEGEQHLKSGKGQNLVSSPNYFESVSTKKPIVIGKVPPREVTIERNSELPNALVESIEVPKDAEVKSVLTVNNPEINKLKSQPSEIETPSATLISEPPVKTLNEKEVISSLSNESVPTIAITTTKISQTQLDANLTVKPDVPPSSTVPSHVDSQIKSVNHPLSENQASSRVPRRKPGARECMQISRKFGAQVIPTKYIQILLDYCSRGKVEHLIRMRERLDEHSRFLEEQLAGLEALVQEKGETDVVVPAVVVDVNHTPIRHQVQSTSAAQLSSGPSVVNSLQSNKNNFLGTVAKDATTESKDLTSSSHVNLSAVNSSKEPEQLHAKGAIVLQQPNSVHNAIPPKVEASIPTKTVQKQVIATGSTSARLKNSTIDIPDSKQIISSVPKLQKNTEFTGMAVGTKELSMKQSPLVSPTAASDIASHLKLMPQSVAPDSIKPSIENPISQVLTQTVLAKNENVKESSNMSEQDSNSQRLSSISSKANPCLPSSPKVPLELNHPNQIVDPKLIQTTFVSKKELIGPQSISAPIESSTLNMESIKSTEQPEATSIHNPNSCPANVLSLTADSSIASSQSEK